MSEAGAIPLPGLLAGVRRQTVLPVSLEGVRLAQSGQTILDGIDLTLGPCGCTFVMGPNGAGKSLLIKLLHGLVRPSAGRIDWNGHTPEAAMRRQSLVFQKPILLRRSVAANVAFALKARGLDRRRTDPLLEHVGLAHKARQPARLLSGGEAQRLALARALATEPDVLFLDEPTASLDPASTMEVERIVREALERGTRVIFVSHDVGQAQRLADDVVFLNRGRVTLHASASDFFPEPACPAAKGFLNGRLVI